MVMQSQSSNLFVPAVSKGQQLVQFQLEGKHAVFRPMRTYLVSNTSILKKWDRTNFMHGVELFLLP